MARNFWMVVQSSENFEISKERGFNLHGLRSRHRRRAQRMGPDDRVLFYVSGIRKWTATASITSKYFEDRTPVWKSYGQREEQYPCRVRMSLSIQLDEEDYVDALVLGPRLEYVKRWPPERWYLAFQDALHLLPQRDFRLIEAEMKKTPSARRNRRRQGQSMRRDGDGRRPATTEEARPNQEVAEEGPVGSVEDGAQPVPSAEEDTKGLVEDGDQPVPSAEEDTKGLVEDGDQPVLSAEEDTKGLVEDGDQPVPSAEEDTKRLVEDGDQPVPSAEEDAPYSAADDSATGSK